MSGSAEQAYAKLNLALHVRGRRDDGYHDIETVFAFCEDGDELAAEPADSLSFTIDGQFGGGIDPQDNLAAKAAFQLRAVSDLPEGAQVRLTKLLPIAAGLGGGSADAAAARRDVATQAALSRERALEQARIEAERRRENVMAIAGLLLVAGALGIGAAGLLESRGRRRAATKY